MFGSGILDLVIGLIFIYFIMSLICSAIRELIANLFDHRYKLLKKWLVLVFSNLGNDILKHPLISGLSTSKDINNFPSSKVTFIPKHIFSTVLLDQLANNDKAPYNFKRIENTILKAGPNTITSNKLDRGFLRVFQQYAEEALDIEDFKSKIENWFEHAMDELVGVYRRKSQQWIFGLAIVVTFSLNVDTIAISKFLYQNPEARKAFADLALAAKDSIWTQKVKFSPIDSLKTTKDTTIEKKDSLYITFDIHLREIQEYTDLLQSTSLPIGWNKEIYTELIKDPLTNWAKKILGILLTAFALSLGAPFWFDLLNKLANIRAAGQHNPSLKKSSEKATEPVG